MGFSTNVKNELAKLPLEDMDEMHAELAAYVRLLSTVRFSSAGMSFSLSTENAAEARRIVYILKTLFDCRVETRVIRTERLKKRNMYEMRVEDEQVISLICEDSGYIKGENLLSRSGKLERTYLRNDRQLRAYIRGTFLSIGTISDPRKGYHLEFPFHHTDSGEDFTQWVHKAGFETKFVLRKDGYVVYVKEGEAISDLLAYMGAASSVLEFESARVVKEVRGRVNRLVNCETANLSKTVSAATEQSMDIRLIEQERGLSFLPENLQEAARLRLENPEASLAEIGRLFQKPISKSGVNHRFQKIHAVAEELRGE